MIAGDHIPLGFKLRQTLRGHTEEINQIVWSPDGRMLASQSSDRTISIWDVETGQRCRTLRESSNEHIAWSPDGQILASGNIFNLLLWDIKTGESHRMAIKSTALGIHCLAWSPDGQTLAS